MVLTMSLLILPKRPSTSHLNFWGSFVLPLRFQNVEDMDFRKCAHKFLWAQYLKSISSRFYQLMEMLMLTKLHYSIRNRDLSRLIANLIFGQLNSFMFIVFQQCLLFHNSKKTQYLFTP